MCRDFVDICGLVKFCCQKTTVFSRLDDVVPCTIFIAFKNSFTYLPCMFLVQFQDHGF